MKEFQISKETAEKQLETLMDYYEIEAPEGAQKESFNQARAKVVKAIRAGRLEITKDPSGALSIVQTVAGNRQLVYAELVGTHRVEAGKVEENGYERIYALVASMVSLPITAISGLGAKDLGAVEGLGLLFLLA